MYYNWLCQGFYLLLTLSLTTAARETKYIYGTSATGVTQQLAVDRTPALYTGEFGDCLGGHSLFNITKFDAAYYTDNSTVLFHLDGASNIKNESLMMRFSMNAYGEDRFQMIFNPCFVNIYSLCPLDAGVPVTAWAVFAVGPAQVGDIPQIAFTIPDFEGSVRLQIFANSTGTEVGCFQASLVNGVTLGHPKGVSPVLAIFALVAIFASFATAAYGISIPHMRTHYAHSVSAMVVFETFQSIFFSGALSVHFPGVLTAWWSNFAWSAGQIYSYSMVKSIDSISGVSGEKSQVGRNGPVSVSKDDQNLAQQIYGRALKTAHGTTHELMKRHTYNASDPYDYTWSGEPVPPGVQLPGTSSGFPGTLSVLNIPAANAFTMGFVWLLVLLGLLALSMAAFKFSLEALVKMKRIKEDRMAYFRGHWISYTILAVLRTLHSAFAMIMTLTFYQFSFGGSSGVKAMAAIFFLLFLVGIGGLAIYAYHSRLKYGRYSVRQDRIQFVCGSMLRFTPWNKSRRRSTRAESELPEKPVGSGSLPIIRLHNEDDDSERANVHQDQAYVKRFGWLSARYRRTRWWFFGCYLLYQLVRAAFIGGASATPMVQVYGLLVFEILAFITFVKLNPFEGQRNTVLAVWMLGTSKIVTTGLSVAFLPSMNLSRIIATGIGLVIFVVQGLLVVGLIILVVLSAISSYMSLTRNRENFSPEELDSTRVRYFEHLMAKSLDVQKSKEEKKRQKILKRALKNAPPPQPSFSVKAVRRVSKIEDEVEDAVGVLDASFSDSVALNPGRTSRISQHKRSASACSYLSTHSLPRAAVPHRVSWSSRDLADWDAASLQRLESGLAGRLSGMSSYGLPPSNAVNAITPYIAEEEPAQMSAQQTLIPRNEPTSPRAQRSTIPSLRYPEEVYRKCSDEYEESHPTIPRSRR
ncbi:hypothetical protein VM1G_00509 [Cytospora mali]|uniref:ML-like domain-containing protein n=1 Tax=Cytospora mali TaxID=578113 RepID=A0A194VNB8_CYTMA|nr:hypothetical protein VM1G_00509 [Valsa mali]